MDQIVLVPQPGLRLKHIFSRRTQARLRRHGVPHADIVFFAAPRMRRLVAADMQAVAANMQAAAANPLTITLLEEAVRARAGEWEGKAAALAL